jgi:large subunit ribosomal protein L5
MQQSRPRWHYSRRSWRASSLQKLPGIDRLGLRPESVNMNRMKVKYQNEVAPALMKAFSLKNVMEIPRIEKVIVNVGLGEAMDNPKALEAATTDLMTITGQKPIQTKARKSIANFKLREGRIIGAKVTLRGERMWDFVDRLLNVALPRVRDFRGVSPKLDGRGNYTLGLRDQLVFPEIEYDKIDKLRGLEITIVTTAQSDELARVLLQLLGMPFRKEA